MMTDATVAYTDTQDSAQAGAYLGGALRDAFGGESPDAAIVFASSRYNYKQLLEALETASRPGVMVGCSSAGEFVSRQQGEYSASAIGIRSNEITFAAGVGRQLRSDVDHAARELVSSFKGVETGPTLFHSALVLTDALAGCSDALIERLNVLTAASYKFFGGGAGDDAQFKQTHVFYGTEVIEDATVALEILSRKPIGVGVQHGWEPVSGPLRVTAAAGRRLISLNAAPAVEVFQEHAEATTQQFDPDNPLSFFLHNVIGIDTGSGYKLRVPLSVHADGSISCAAEIPEGVLVYFMGTNGNAGPEAAVGATQTALEQLQGHAPEVAIFFDCVATRLRMGQGFGLEMRALDRALGSAKYAGCNTYGQVARVEGQFSGFHNCTAIVCVIPK